MSIVSREIGTKSHGHLVPRFTTASRIPVAFKDGITLSRGGTRRRTRTRTPEIVKVAGLVAFDGAGVAGAA